ncbi:porin [Noviherbaspirillum galbum]|uniref:Porin n=1 Tax=Noviherbaspirillum galbum TaxID=2709383 RepID=A0A6B3SUZ8_9BURK|nr:porin [Noviherbaspirillum galbum]NEX64633.1 porin [Noviherbaspirillum galbum]
MKLRNAVFLGLATAASAGLVHAQTNVSLYGDIDEYIGYIRSSTGQHVVGLNDGAILRSRLGFRGVEELGGGLQAKFQLEQGLNADTGTFADSTRLFDRQAWLGIGNSTVGEFRFGRQNTAIFFIGGAIDYTERTTFGSIINTFGVPSRYDNDISWKSPRWAGVQVELHYALNETPNAQGRGVAQLGVDYANGPYRVGYAGLSARPQPTATIDERVVYHNVYANYDYGKGKVYLAAVRSNNVTASAAGNDAAAILNNVSNPANTFAGTDPNVRRFYNIWQVSADYRVSPQLRVGALYGGMRDTTGNGAGARGGNVGAYYDLSKRTTFYGFANYMKNEANAGFRFSGSAGPSANLAGGDINGQSLTGLQFGVLHRF